MSECDSLLHPSECLIGTRPGAEKEEESNPVCPACMGDGEVRGNASRDMDPQADDFKRCVRCGGTGKP